MNVQPPRSSILFGGLLLVLSPPPLTIRTGNVSPPSNSTPRLTLHPLQTGMGSARAQAGDMDAAPPAGWQHRMEPSRHATIATTTTATLHPTVGPHKARPRAHG
ncbi:hypothetical protein BDZ89DRAFT_60087 [Hymenopellis radicata]|nr:hypothetical protein BDZ89DRAFT_60087 [Hymenopellis radicata]